MLYDCCMVVIVLWNVNRGICLLGLSGRTWYFIRRAEQLKVFRILNCIVVRADGVYSYLYITPSIVTLTYRANDLHLSRFFY